jgi:hypothetical protein
MLSPTMSACLAAVKAQERQPANELPGGINTVWALMRRRLVETDRSEEWHVFLPAHAHVFMTTMHLDGCHWYKTTGVCDCGVVYGASGERSVKADPYSGVWMSEPGTCARCAALFLLNARPRYEVVIQRPSNYSPPLEVV